MSNPRCKPVHTPFKLLPNRNPGKSQPSWSPPHDWSWPDPATMNKKIEIFSKKISKIDFFLNVENGFQGSQIAHRTIADTIRDPYKPFLTFKKKSIFEIFLKKFRFLRFFLARHNGLLIFDFGPADPHKVPARYPIIYFLESWASGEYVWSLVCHCQGSFWQIPAPSSTYKCRIPSKVAFSLKLWFFP